VVLDELFLCQDNLVFVLPRNSATRIAHPHANFYNTELHCREEEADKAIDGSDVSRPRNLGKVSCAQAIVKSKAVSVEA